VIEDLREGVSFRPHLGDCVRILDSNLHSYVDYQMWRFHTGPVYTSKFTLEMSMIVFLCGTCLGCIGT